DAGHQLSGARVQVLATLDEDLLLLGHARERGHVSLRRARDRGAGGGHAGRNAEGGTETNQVLAHWSYSLPAGRRKSQVLIARKPVRSSRGFRADSVRTAAT